eukprot:TRINITY_DN15902_c0_g1_i1.p1 TRINITY_DN15902_c0_g1~~TRINITY_DN15902_c0_g1_i1.p1  ORF type:complete len:283 (+),score=70.48 TRINITY_DN15902_c0_g1_i1:53-850(+)
MLRVVLKKGATMSWVPVATRRYASGLGKDKEEMKTYEDKKKNKEQQKEAMADRELVLKWIQMGLIGILGPLAGWWSYSNMKKEREGFRTSEMKSVGKASVGGDWTLVDIDGKPRTRADFYGTFPIMYFGFTHCPEICPVELNRMSKVTDALREKFPLASFTPLFVSCDPGRDSLREIKAYLSEFHKDFLGLVGTPQQVESICKSHRIYYSAPSPLESTEGDYLIDHSIAIYFFDNNFEFMEVFGSRFNEEEIVEGMAKLMAQRGF